MAQKNGFAVLPVQRVSKWLFQANRKDLQFYSNIDVVKLCIRILPRISQNNKKQVITISCLQLATAVRCSDQKQVFL